MRRREHQSGFGTTVILLAVLVVAVLAVTGLVVYQRHKNTSAKNSAATSQTQTTTQPQSTVTTQTQQAGAHYLDIKEWGVRLTLDSTTASMYYYIKPKLSNVAYVSLKTISAIAPNCAADKFSLGAISRLTPAEQQSILSGPTKGTPGTIHIGNYWFSVENSRAACTDGTAAMNAAVSNAAPNYNPGVLLNTLNTLAADPSTN